LSNYTQSTNFATKDALSPGDPLKIVRGTEINTEFTNIAVAVATKLDTTGLASPGPIGATTPSSFNGTTGTFSGAVSGTTGTFSGNVQMASQNGGQLAGLRNKIINGNMTVCQRATSTAGVTGGTQSFLVDRFRTGGQATAAVVTTSQSSDVPSGLYGFSARIAVTTADTAVASTDVFAVVQPIEGYNISDLFGKTFTLSFWVRSSKTGTHCAAFSNTGDRSYVVEYTISVANTWEYKTITVSGGLTTAGTWDLANGTGLSVRFTLVAGATFQTTAGAWNTGNFFGTSSQVNCLDTIGNIFAIAQVQLEVGPVATPFEQRPIGMELALCQRYYYRIYAITGTGGFHQAQVNTTVQAAGIIPYPVQMRTNPTALEQSGTATDYRINFASTNVICSAVPSFNSATNYNNGYVMYTVASGLTAGQSCGVIANSVNAYLGWSAEL
jgi:hypothetical protein